MADISDVDQALVNFISSTVYPNGTSSPSAVIVNGQPVNVRVFAGWPNPSSLDSDAANGVVNISVFPQPGNERNTSRFERRWYALPQTTPTITATQSGAQVTIAGAVTLGHFVTIHAGNKPGSYAAQAGDTFASIAAALAAALTAAGVTCTSSGPTLTVPNTVEDRLIIRTGAPGRAVCELGRSQQRYHITIWAPNNAVRAATAIIVRPALEGIDTVDLPDNFVGELKYESSCDVDRSGKQNISCRDLFFWVEYPTTIGMVSYPLTTFVTEIEQDNNLTHITPLPLESFTPEVTSIS